MKKVSSITDRKAEHIKINLEQNVRSGCTTGLERYGFVHEALPEVNLADIESTLKVFGKQLSAPILISAMTGGTKTAEMINRNLAEAAAQTGIAMSVGSQRAALEQPDQVRSFSIARSAAPGILLFANLGAIQLNYGVGVKECQKAIDMLQADGLILHLNPLQEAVQAGGNTNFFQISKKIELICKSLDKPVIAKEVGWGISERTAKILVECGVAAIDVAGAGGTSWTQVEMYRATDEKTRQLAACFKDWGITTAESILNVKRVAPGIPIFASGGLQTGLDIAKCISLGASLGGMAGMLLKPATVSSGKVIEAIELIIGQLKVTMFATGSVHLQDLANKVVKKEYGIN